MQKFATAAVFAIFAAPASAAVVVHDIIVQRSIWVQLMGLLGY